MPARNPTPRYVQIATYLRILIQRGNLKKGSQLPTELELCRRFDCSRSTVRQALDTLVRDGIVSRVRGAGTFVSDAVVASNNKLLAAIVPNVTNSEIARFMQVMGTAAIESGYTLLLSVTNDIPEIERQFIDEIARLKVVGVLKFPTNIEAEEETRAQLREYGLPYVVINDFWTDSRQDYHIMYDECAAVEMAVEHLVELGHERLAFLDDSRSPRQTAGDTFFKSLARHDLPREENQLVLYDIGSKGPPVEELYGSGTSNPTGLITAFDLIAGRLVTQLRKFEVRVPEDISIVNINGKPLELPEGMDLTTAVPPNKTMIDQALKALAGGLHDTHVRHYVYRPCLHLGQTSGPCPSDVPVCHTENAPVSEHVMHETV